MNRKAERHDALAGYRAALRVTNLTALGVFTGVLAASAIGAAEPSGKDASVEARFDAAIDPAEMDGWLEIMAAAPNHVGSPHNEANAERILAQFRNWGWDAEIETFDVLYPTPIEVSLDLIGETPFAATLTEPPVAGDAPTQTRDALPAYLAYQGDGDVTAPLVYVNYGMPDDYETLKRLGVSVEGKIVLARYGGGWRGLKPKLAQEHGAVGTIIYSDPSDDGYATDDVYPQGEARPPQGLQRGSVMDMTTYPGDPLTPGAGSTARAKRLGRAESAVILKIPAIAISYRDAETFLDALGGQVAPPPWRGSLGITYHVGGDATAPSAHLVVDSDWSLKTIRDVVARMPGSAWPDQWVLRGNHYDGWVMGAGDPLSGQIALLAEAKAIGELVASGWRPKRTLVYLAWDAEEPGLIGSTEWAEAHAEELKDKALVYVNSDGNARGFLRAGGSHSLQHFVNEVAADVVDPEMQVPVGERRRATLVVRGLERTASEEDKKLAAVAAAPEKDLPINALGSGSDYSPFLQHLGLAALNIGYGGEGGRTGGAYHSLYDDYARFSRFVDAGAIYSATLAKTIGRLVLRFASADLPPQRYADFADTVTSYLDEVKQLADAKREAADAQSKALDAGFFGLASDPTKPRGEPTRLQSVPHFNFAPLENAVDRLSASAQTYDAMLADTGASLSDADKAVLFDLARETEQALAPPEGLPGRPWYQNLIYAPGTLTGYGAKTLPGVREAIEQERWDDVDRYAALTAAALEAYADKLDAGVMLLTR
jgi:N-acetylated-alpha-linked acidic dipeptidase